MNETWPAVMADPASQNRSILEAVSRTISETVNVALAQVGIQPEFQSYETAIKRDSPLKFYYVVLLDTVLDRFRVPKIH